MSTLAGLWLAAYASRLEHTDAHPALLRMCQSSRSLAPPLQPRKGRCQATIRSRGPLTALNSKGEHFLHGICSEHLTLE